MGNTKSNEIYLKVKRRNGITKTELIDKNVLMMALFPEIIGNKNYFYCPRIKSIIGKTGKLNEYDLVDDDLIEMKEIGVPLLPDFPYMLLYEKNNYPVTITFNFKSGVFCSGKKYAMKYAINHPFKRNILETKISIVDLSFSKIKIFEEENLQEISLEKYKFKYNVLYFISGLYSNETNSNLISDTNLSFDRDEHYKCQNCLFSEKILSCQFVLLPPLIKLILQYNDICEYKNDLDSSRFDKCGFLPKRTFNGPINYFMFTENFLGKSL